MGYYDDYLQHHGILGQRKGHRNGPPYPLGSGKHSIFEKRAAKQAGIKVGSDSGKGSIEKVKGAHGSNQHAKKAPLTEEEKRLKAEEAQLNGDSKKITKYMDKLTTEELQDAQTRAKIRKELEGPKEKKMTKSEREIDDAIKSGDKEKVKEYADKMSYQQLDEAMKKIDLMKKLNYVEPKPSTMDKIKAATEKANTIKNALETGLKAYNALAAVNNTFNKDSQWPILKSDKNNNDNNKGDKNNKNDKNEKSFEDKINTVTKGIEKISKEMNNSKAQNEAKNNKSNNSNKNDKQQSDLQKAKDDLKESKKAVKAAKKEQKLQQENEKLLKKAKEFEEKAAKEKLDDYDDDFYYNIEDYFDDYWKDKE